MSFDVDAYLREHLADVRESGKERIASCPGCGKASKFYASTTAPFGFLCFSECGVKGRGILSLIVAVEGVSRREAFARMAGVARGPRAGTPADLEAMLSKMRDPVEERAPVDVPLPDEFVPCFDGTRWRWPRYLTTRGVTREAAQRFGMGYAPRGRYFGRVVIPIACPNGRSFTARDTTGKSEVPYLNPKKTDGAEHARLVLGWPEDETAWRDAEVFLVEGPLDAVRMWQHGLPALSLLGKVLHLDQLEMLAGIGAAGFVVMLDPDEEEAPIEVAERLSAISDRVWIAKLRGDPADGKKLDPGVSTAEQVREAYLAAQPFRGRRALDLAAALSVAGRGLMRKST